MKNLQKRKFCKNKKDHQKNKSTGLNIHYKIFRKSNKSINKIYKESSRKPNKYNRDKRPSEIKLQE